MRQHGAGVRRRLESCFVSDLVEEGTTTIPLLPAISFDESLAFWKVLGFEVTLRQKEPSSCAVVGYEDFELHLIGLKQLEPGSNFTTCLPLRRRLLGRLPPARGDGQDRAR